MRVSRCGWVIPVACLLAACADEADESEGSTLPGQGGAPMGGSATDRQGLSGPPAAPAPTNGGGSMAGDGAPTPVAQPGGMNPSGMGTQGMGTQGMGTQGMGTQGMGTQGMGTQGGNPPGMDPAGMDPAGMDPTDMDPTGMDPTGTDPTGMDPTGMDPTGMDPTAGPESSAQALPPTTDYAAPGPFGTTSETNTGPGRGYAIFRPDPMGEDGFLHSPLVFGPGILTSPSMYEALFEHLASHGFVIICVNSLGGGPGAPANVEAMKEGLEWLIAQNTESGVFEGKLAVDRAITMGYSLGATASVQLSSHEAVATSVAIHGHGTSGDPHGPVLLLTGTDDVIDSVRQTHGTLDEAPAAIMALPIGHLDVLAELAMLARISPSARYIAPITAWLRYWINGDEEAKSFFWGADCTMCSSPWITPETNAAWDALAL